jgi:transposase
MIQYGKPALTTDQQVDLLIRRGMHIANRVQARQYLTHISYYRLRAYWLPFEQAAANGDDHAFATWPPAPRKMKLHAWPTSLLARSASSKSATCWPSSPSATQSRSTTARCFWIALSP